MPTSGSSRLSAGAIAGIVIGVVGGAALIAIAALVAHKLTKRRYNTIVPPGKEIFSGQQPGAYSMPPTYGSRV